MPTLILSDPSYCSTKITAYSSTLKSSPTLSTNPSPFPRTRALSLHTQLSSCLLRALLPKSRSRTKVSASTMATGSVQEVRPPSLDSTSDPPAIFDRTTRLYISYACPYAQRVWITRNCKGLQDKIKLVPIDLQNRPTWYKEKVYPPNKVPSLEHNNEVKGESLDLVKYIDSNFEGPSLFPSDPDKRQFAEELLSYTDSFNKGVITSFKADGMNDADAAFDYIEMALSKFDNGPFFLGQFSLVDIAYAPFIERFQPFLLDVKKYDITAGRPKLATWIEAVWLKVELCKLLQEKQSAVLRAEELETALMEMVKQDNRRQLSARVEELEREVAELHQAVADKQEQENAMLQVLMRVEQEQRVTEDARIFAEQDAAAQRYAAQLLQEKYEEVTASLAEMEKRAVMAESMLEATLQYQSGQTKAQPSPRSVQQDFSPVRTHQEPAQDLPMRKITLLSRPFGLGWRDRNKGKPEEPTNGNPIGEGPSPSAQQKDTNGHQM